MCSNLLFHIGANSTLQGVGRVVFLPTFQPRKVFEDWSSTWRHYPRVYTRGDGTMVSTAHAALINGGRCLQPPTNEPDYTFQDELQLTSPNVGDRCKEWRKLKNVTIAGSGTIGNFFVNLEGKERGNGRDLLAGRNVVTRSMKLDDLCWEKFQA